MKDYQCQKCESIAQPKVKYVDRFAYYVDRFGSFPLCKYDRCPSGEHLHVTCRACGYDRPEPVAGVGRFVPKARPKPAERAPRWWHFWRTA